MIYKVPKCQKESGRKERSISKCLAIYKLFQATFLRKNTLVHD